MTHSSKLRFTRRWLLVGGILGATLTAPVAWGYARGAPSVIRAILRRRLGFLKLRPGTFETFAKAYVETQAEHARKLEMLALLAVPLRWWSPYRMLSLGHPLRRLEDSVVSNFLLSTDFFEHAANEIRDVEFIAMHNPDSPRPNPFAVNYYTSR